MSIYVNVELCSIWNRFGEVKVYLNNKLITDVIEAKSGKDGFVMFYANRLQLANDRTSLLTRKLRGNVKISFAHRR